MDRKFFVIVLDAPELALDGGLQIRNTSQCGGAATKHSLSSIGWRRGLGRGRATPLLGPLPTPASWGEEEEKRATKIVAACDDFDRY